MLQKSKFLLRSKSLISSTEFSIFLFYVVHFCTYIFATSCSLVLLSTADQVLWHAFIIINGLFLLSEFGTGPVIVRLTSFIKCGAKDLSLDIDIIQKSRSTDKIDKISFDKLFNLVRKFYNLLILPNILIFGITGYYYINNLSTKLDNYNENTISAFIFLLLSLPLSLRGRMYHNLLTGLGYQRTVYLWNTLCTILISIMYLFILYRKGDILDLILVGQSIHLVLYLRNQILFKKIYRKLFDSHMPPKLEGWQYFNAFWSPSVRGFLGLTGSMGIFQFINLSIANVLPATLSASYLLTIRLITIAEQAANVFLVSKLPSLNIARAKSHMGEIQTITIYLVRIVLFVYISTCIIIFSFTYFMLPYISLNTPLLSIEILTLLVSFGILSRHHTIHTHVFSTLNKEPFYIPIIITSILNLYLLTLLIDKFQVLGVVLASGLANIVILNWWCVKISIKSINFSIFQYFNKLFNPFKLT